MKLKDYQVILLLALVGLIVFGNTFNNQLFWDDDDIILNNEFVHNFELGKFFSENMIAGSNLVSNYWRPLLLTVFSLQWQVWGDWVGGYHFVNLTFHVGCAILLFFLLNKLFGTRLLSFLTSLVFLIHPVQPEAVAYVSGLADPLSTFLMFAGILFYLKYRDTAIFAIKSKYFWLAFLFFILAVLAKDTAVVLPAMIFLADFFYLPANFRFWQKIKRALQSLWLFFAVSGAYLLLRATVLNFQNTFNVYNEPTLFTENFFVRLLTFFRAMAVYVELLFMPNNLHMERALAVAHGFSADVIFGGLLTVALLAMAFLALKKYPIIAFGIFWFFIRLFPNSNLLFPNAALIYDHWLYVPLIGIFLALIWSLLKFAKILEQKLAASRFWRELDFQKIFAAGLIIYLIPLSILTIARNNDWQDPIRFYNQVLAYNQSSYRIYNNLGMAYADAGKNELALNTFDQAVRLNPEIAVAYHNLGNTYRDLGKLDLAEQNYLVALEKDQEFLFTYGNLINLYLNQKKYDQALIFLRKFDAVSPGNESVQNLINQLENENRPK